MSKFQSWSLENAYADVDKLKFKADADKRRGEKQALELFERQQKTAHGRQSVKGGLDKNLTE